ncbi:MAG: alpha/beta fold hydrolase [Planctomycetota bacterium]
MSGCTVSMRRLVVMCAIGLGTIGSPACADELPRKGRLGVMLAPAPGGGITLAGTMPGSGAEEAGLQAGDVLLAINGENAQTMVGIQNGMAGVGAGDTVEITVLRGSDELELELVTQEGPKTTLNAREVEYASVALEDGARLRTLLSMPEEAEHPVPAVFFIQGIPCSSIEMSAGNPNPVRAQLEVFDDAGFATFRVEKPGCGDSQGGPCSELGFDRELEGYMAGFEALLADDRIDRDRVYLYGASMGGIMAPFMAARHEVAGVAVWGTGISNWMEYLIENRRNQALLFGSDRAQLEDTTHAFNTFVSEMCTEGKTPAQIAKEHPEHEAVFGIIGVLNDPTGYAGRHALFHQELSARNAFGAWAQVEAPVLVMHGEYDWVAFEKESELIVDFVNDIEEDRADFLSVPNMDHGFTTHERFDDSLTNAFQGDWDDEVGNVVIEWIEDLEQNAEI